MKPFYKKFCIIRNLNNIDYNSQLDHINNSVKISIQKNRKNLEIFQMNDKSSVKFDYISSLIDNPYEEVNYSKENQIINEELINIFSSYLIKMNQFNDERDLCVLYLTNKLAVNKNEENNLFNINMNNNIILIIQELMKRISNQSELTFKMKLSSNEEFYEVIKEINYNNKINFQSEIEKSIINFFITTNNSENLNLSSIVFSVRNKKNNCKLKILIIDYNNLSVTTSLISKLNEMNISKKKREKSSKRGKKIQKDVQCILNEMEFNSGFFFNTIIDTTLEEFQNPNFKEILLNI